MRKIFGALVLVSLWTAAVNVRSTTITAASCNAAHVQAALSQAGAGDTVHIPAGTCSWTTQVRWMAPANVTLRGAGSTTTLGGGDATVIVDDFASGAPLLDITTNASGSFRLHSLTIRKGQGSLKEDAVLKISGASKQLRIDHIRMNMRTGHPDNSKPIRFVGHLNGVLDSSIIDLGGIGWVHFQGGGEGDAAWAANTGFGTSDFIFLEDNQISGTWVIATLTDCNAGGRFVIRYNTISGAGVGQTHPTGGSGRGRGCRAHELYGNTVSPWAGYSTDQQPPFTFSYISSGAAVLWGNRVSGFYKHFLVLRTTRKDSATYAQAPNPNGWGYCGTAFNGTGSGWDGNLNPNNGYPCVDQPGRGRGQLLSGHFPNAVNTASGSISWPNQALEPIYEWSNAVSLASGCGGHYLSVDSGVHIAGNRDYYLYTPSFNGTSGMGSGPLANRPAACTRGVAYWATDQGEWNSTNGSNPDGRMFVCTATNTWTARYGGGADNTSGMPYSYPHPLRGGVRSVPTDPLPAAPTGIRIVR